MPRIAHFHEIVIAMYYAEHGPPHFHARHAAFDAQVSIRARLCSAVV
jgi:Domain of unknown function (DUF4160)